MPEAKPYSISKVLVVEAFRRGKANRGAAGVDGQSLAAFEKDLKGNLYRIWNRMSSGSYMPPPVRFVEIPKADGKKRPLGIPTVADRVAQMVAKLTFEPLVEPIFHQDSYGYRPGKSALDAVGRARTRCFHMNWVIDLDIRDFFGSLDHELMTKAVKRHTDLKWLHLYMERWLKAPLQLEEGSLKERLTGTPQGGVVSPVLANLFMHYAFDAWMAREFPSVPFERYADDVVIHCVSQSQAEFVLEAVRRRLKECRLELHPEKTRIVYCKDGQRRGDFKSYSFDFLGYTFRPRTAKGTDGGLFCSFQPAISDKAANRIRAAIRGWHLTTWRATQKLEGIARLLNPAVRGWVAFYGRYYRSRCLGILNYYLMDVLVRWAMRKYKQFRGHWRKAYRWLGRIAAQDSELFYHWSLGLKPAAGR